MQQGKAKTNVTFVCKIEQAYRTPFNPPIYVV